MGFNRYHCDERMMYAMSLGLEILMYILSSEQRKICLKVRKDKLMYVTFLEQRKIDVRNLSGAKKN